ncbi:MAG: hypothetical protein ACI308_08225 [Muribaculaceae bacterium]
MDKSSATYSSQRQRMLQAAEGYFNATLTPVQEQELKQYVANTCDPAFDQVKAVMAFAAVGRQAHMHAKTLPTLWRIASAACIAAIVATAAFAAFGNKGDMVAYAGGQRITNQDQVMQQMLTAMQSIDINNSKSDIVEDQIKDMINYIH